MNSNIVVTVLDLFKLTFLINFTILTLQYLCSIFSCIILVACTYKVKSDIIANVDSLCENGRHMRCTKSEMALYMPINNVSVM